MRSVPWGYHDACGGYLEYHGGYHDVCGGIMNTLRGYLEYCGDTQYHEGYYDAV